MNIRHFISLFSVALLFVSCGSQPKVEEDVTPLAPVQGQEEAPVQELPAPEEEKTEEEVAVVEEVDDDDEYHRSINDLSAEESVSKVEFEEDKKQILKKIEELQEIMDTKDYNDWRKHLDPESITYYSNAANIRKAQKKLPDKTIQLHGMKDYFEYVFIPSRKRSQVDEIRYISKTNVKAVQVKSDNSVVIYYYFVKKNNQWLVHIPEL